MLTAVWSINTFFRHFFLALFAVLSLTSCDYLSRRILTKPVVQVENRRLTTQEFSQELANRLKDFDALSAKDPKILEVHRNQIINDFIISTVIDLWCIENKVVVSKEELEAEIKKVSSAYPNDSSFREALNEAGISFAEWSKKFEQTLQKKHLLAQLRKNTPQPTEQELNSYYLNNRQRFEQKESVFLSHIQVADENQAEIVMKLLRKQKFNEVAQEYSSAYRKETGDVYGWIEKGYLTELDKAFKMRVGEVFGPVKMVEGMHIFKITEKRPLKVKSFAEAKSEATADVLALREQALFSSWLEEQFKRYSIKKNKAVLESIKVETQ